MKKAIAAVLIWSSFATLAQDPTFSQFNMSKVFLNPAYAGYTRDLNVTMHSRLQWTNVVGRFSTNSFTANVGCPTNRVGFGFRGYYADEGEGFLRNVNAAGLVSVNLPGRFGPRTGRFYGKKYIVSFGLQFGVGQRFIDWNRLTFTDQLDVYEGQLGIPSAAGPQNGASNLVLDVSGGIRGRMEVGNRGSYLSGGFAMWHVNRPIESFFNLETQIEPRYTGHVFAHFKTSKFKNNSNFLTLGFVYDHQQVLSQNIISASMDFWDFLYLGVSFRRKEVFAIDRNVDAVIFQAMYIYKGLGVGYSYDVTISDLYLESTYGTHEIGITYTIPNSTWCLGRRQRPRALDCFYLNSESTNRDNIHFR